MRVRNLTRSCSSQSFAIPLTVSVGAGTEMITEGQHAPLRKVQSERAGSPVHCASNTNSRLHWRRLGWFSAATALTGFALNEIWEMAQMLAYVEMAGHPWTSTLGRCTAAAAGDVGIILGIYAASALAAGDPGWGLRGRWNIYATSALFGLAWATLVEHAALAAGSWSYMESMPMVPWLRAGLWPLLQMTLLPPLTFWIARRWAGRNTTKGAIYEPY